MKGYFENRSRRSEELSGGNPRNLNVYKGSIIHERLGDVFYP